LNSIDHITASFYENSNMHQSRPCPKELIDNQMKIVNKQKKEKAKKSKLNDFINGL